MRITYPLFTKPVLAVMTILLVFSSCQKEKNNDDGCAATMASIAGTYKFIALTYKESPGAADVDYLVFMEDCEKDDLIDMLANGVYDYRDAGTTCSPAGSDSGIWSISGNTIISDGIIAGKVQSFDCRTLVVYMENVTVPGDKFTVTVQKQ